MSLRRCVLAFALLSVDLASAQGPVPADAAARAAAPAPTPIRVGLRARGGGANRLDPLRYIGGFETKTLVYETLVRRGDDGRLAPGLASAWQIAPDGRSVRFELRPGAEFHDGTAVTATAVQTHFRRWLGLPEHDWIRANRHIRGVDVVSPTAFVVQLDEPYAVLADLCCINPCAIVGPGARDWEGEFTRPIGTGPFRFDVALDGGRRWRVVRVADGQPLEIAFFARGADTGPARALLAGELDAFVGGWDEDLPQDTLAELAADPRLVVQRARGSSVVHLTFRLDAGPTQARAIRRRIAAALDRAALIRDVEGGAAEPCTTWAAPKVAFWPHGPGIAVDAAAATTPLPRIAIAAGRGEGRAARVAAAVADQLRAAGFPVDLLTLPHDAGTGDTDATNALNAASATERAAARSRLVALAEAADVRVEISHGIPYDPQQSLVARFGPVRRAGEPEVRAGNTLELLRLVTAAAETTAEDWCLPIYAQVQTLMDREALVVPLYVPFRLAVHTRDVDGIALGADVYRVDLNQLRRAGP